MYLLGSSGFQPLPSLIWFLVGTHSSKKTVLTGLLIKVLACSGEYKSKK